MEDLNQTKILPRILQSIGGEEALKSLIALNNSDFQSLMLEVYRGRAAPQTPPQLLKAYQDNPFVRPTDLGYDKILEFDQWLLNHLPESFEVLELSPISPLGSCSTLATVHQNKVIGAGKNAEVVADATNVMALECAMRRQKLLMRDPKDSQTVHLASSHRHIRNQPSAESRHTPHFRIMGLCSAGRDQGNYKFEVEMLSLHIEYYQTLFKQLQTQHDFEVALRITFWPEVSSHTVDVVMQKLQQRLPDQEIEMFPQRSGGQSYYPRMCFRMDVKLADQEINLVDGGFTPWTRHMLSNGKERLLISGLGSELLMRVLKL